MIRSATLVAQPAAGPDIVQPQSSTAHGGTRRPVTLAGSRSQWRELGVQGETAGAGEAAPSLHDRDHQTAASAGGGTNRGVVQVSAGWIETDTASC